MKIDLKLIIEDRKFIVSDAENIRKNILSTIIYYDILDFPLTSYEIWEHLLAADNEKGKCSLGDVVEVLENKELKKYIGECRGFYFLKERRSLVEQRIQNDKNSIVKYKIARKVAGWMRFAPFVRMVAVTGTLAMKNPKRDSDIDFLIVLERGRIFTGRLLATAIVHLLGRRRYGKKIKNRICLNYFVTTGSLKIKRRDIFAANEYTFIYPLLGNDVFRKFCEANIGWISAFKPNWEIPAASASPQQKGTQKFFESLINFAFGDRMEVWLRNKQIVRIEQNPLTRKSGAYVEYDDENLIFLPEPQGPKILEKYMKKADNGPTLIIK